MGQTDYRMGIASRELCAEMGISLLADERWYSTGLRIMFPGWDLSKDTRSLPVSILADHGRRGSGSPILQQFTFFHRFFSLFLSFRPPFVWPGDLFRGPRGGVTM
jgi:hypothetical protein